MINVMSRNEFLAHEQILGQSSNQEQFDGDKTTSKSMSQTYHNFNKHHDIFKSPYMQRNAHPSKIGQIQMDVLNNKKL